MKKNRLWYLVLILIMAACDDAPKQTNGQPAETVRAGSVEIACDESIYTLLKGIQPVYDTAFPDAKITLKPMPARAAMADLFALKSRGIIVARGYTRDEDSVLKAYKRSPHAQFLLAKDALVFFTQRSFPLDTISKNQLAELLVRRAALIHDFIRVIDQLIDVGRHYFVENIFFRREVMIHQ